MIQNKRIKKLLASIGLLAIAVPTSLSVAACEPSKKNYQEADTKSETELVVEAINKAKYIRAIPKKISVLSLKILTHSDFIVDNLSLEIKKIFDYELFTLNTIVTEDNRILVDDDLKETKIINAKIVYDYWNIKDQETSLKIIVREWWNK